MEEIQLKMKQWSQSIRMGEFHGIADEIQDTFIPSTEESNERMYKLILYMCQTAQQCDKTNATNGLNISKITCIICSKLSSIPNVSKFFAAVYYIVCKLIEMKLYKESMQVGNLLLPGSLFHKVSTNCFDMYSKFSTLWYKTIDELFGTFKKFDDKNLHLIMMLIEHELEFQKLALKDGSKYLFNKIIAYNDKIMSIKQELFYDKFKLTVMNYLTHTKISLGKESKLQTYKSALNFLISVIISKTNIKTIKTTRDQVMQFFSIFKHCMKEDQEYFECFTAYEELCQIILREVDEFTEEHFCAIERYKYRVNALEKKYGNASAIKWNLYSIIQFIESLLIYWEKDRKENGEKSVTEKFLVSIVALLDHHSNFFPSFTIPECYCHESDCKITTDIYNAMAMALKALRIFVRYIKSASLNQIKAIMNIIRKCVLHIYELHHAKCKKIHKIWTVFGSLVYNIGVYYEKTKYEETIELYEILANVTVDLRAFDAESSYVDFDHPLSVAFHRLSNTHYFHKNYDSAMIACALNAYISYENEKSKAFRFWTSIKYKSPSSHDITIIDCLKSIACSVSKIKIVIDLKNVDLSKICQREIMSLEEADINLSSSIITVLDIMGDINVDPLVYVQSVQRLGYHMLNFHTKTPISKYIQKALLQLKQINTKYIVIHEILRGHLKFYEFIEELKQINEITETEMQKSKIRLHAALKSDSGDELDRNVVPTYSRINITTAIEIGEKLENVLKIWTMCYEKKNFHVNNFLEPSVMIRTAIIAAEYINFYQYDNLKENAWKIAFNLAKKFNNDAAIIYITGRCISSQYINNEWIQQAENCVEKLKDSTNQTIIETIAIFKLSLSELYFNMGLMTEADKLFESVIALPNIEFGVNLATYLMSLDILLSHKFNSEYVKNIIKGLYTSLTIDENGSMTRQTREEYLYELDILFQFTNHVALNVNSIISYREISAHLVRRLSMAQKFGAALHAAECLKNLCFIDLSRNKLEDCEVKLQGLEHILMIETVEMSMKSDILSTRQNNVTPTQIIEPVRDVFQNDTSPVLRSKVFETPNFMNHCKNCACFNCSNRTYQYLIFSCTHIRAQIYALQNHTSHALQHFHGAFNMIRKILKLSDESICLHRYHEIVEYVLFMLDFARYLKRSVPLSYQDGLNITLHAVEMCEKYRITNSPVYLTAKELIFEYRFEALYENIDYTTFAMPNVNFEDEQYNENVDSEIIYTTPMKTVTPKPAKSVLRKKSPPLLTLSKVSIDTIEYNDEITMDSLRPNVGNVSVKKKVLKVRPIRRKISEDDYNSSENFDEVYLTSSTKSQQRRTSRRTNENPNKECLDQEPKNSGVKTSVKKKIFKSSDESSEKNENIDGITNKLNVLQLSESNDDEYVTSTNSSRKKSSNRQGNSSSQSTTIIHKQSTGRRKGSDNNFSKTNFNSKSLHSSCDSEVNSEVDIIECSIEEPRRSRRLATQIKTTRNRL